MTATDRSRRIRRSCLAVPGSSLRKLEKAAASDADQVFIDLEDAVAPSEKATARTQAVEALTSFDFGSKVRTLRINDVSTPFAFRDVIEVVAGAPGRLDCVMVPKVRGASDVHFVDHLLEGLEAELELERPLGLELLIESARGGVDLASIARASNRTETIIFGVGDYAIDIGVLRAEIGTIDPRYPGHQWHWIMSEISVHAHALGIQAIDGPSVNFTDRDGYAESARRAKLLGFHGKWCIHPNQVPWANDAFSVSRDEYEQATALRAALAEAVESKSGAAVFEGFMVDAATGKLAEKLIALADERGVQDDGAAK
jgi:citrate lyase subunit beta/citryl-CoA lyase